MIGRGEVCCLCWSWFLIVKFALTGAAVLSFDVMMWGNGCGLNEPQTNIRPVALMSPGCFFRVQVDLPHNTTASPVAINFTPFRTSLDL